MSAPDGRKHVSHSLSPIALLKSPNGITLVTLLAVLAAAVLVIFVVRFVVCRLRGRRYSGRSRRYRG